MNADSYERLLPEITQENQPFWDGLAAGELRLQRCAECGELRFPESQVCPACLSDAYTWRAVTGKGRLWSWIVMHQKYYSAFADTVPYLVAYVKLDEGPAVISTLVDPQSELRLDMPVRAVFGPRAGTKRSILMFTPDRQGASR